MDVTIHSVCVAECSVERSRTFAWRKRQTVPDPHTVIFIIIFFLLSFLHFDLKSIIKTTVFGACTGYFIILAISIVSFRALRVLHLLSSWFLAQVICLPAGQHVAMAAWLLSGCKFTPVSALAVVN